MTGPLIVTTKRQDGDDRNCDCLIPMLEGAGQHSPGCACFNLRVLSRVAVATLKEVVGIVDEAFGDASLSYERVVRALPESGGTITLPDGTVIEVKQTTWQDLALWAKLTFPATVGSRAEAGDEKTRREVLDAFNDRQKAAA